MRHLIALLIVLGGLAVWAWCRPYSNRGHIDVLAGHWTVVPIRVGRAGVIHATRVIASVPTRMAVAVFDRLVTPEGMVKRTTRTMPWGGQGNWARADDFFGTWFCAHPHLPGYWESFGEDSGLVVAWGGYDNPAGHGTGTAADGDPLTGELYERAPWTYDPGKRTLYVAVWCEEDAEVSVTLCAPGEVLVDA